MEDHLKAKHGIISKTEQEETAALWMAHSGLVVRRFWVRIRPLFFSPPVSELSRTDHEIVRHATELPEKLLAEHPPMGSKAARQISLPKDGKRLDMYTDIRPDRPVEYHTTPLKGLVQAKTGNQLAAHDETRLVASSKLRHVEYQTSLKSRDCKAASATGQEKCSTPCSTCKAFRELIAMGFGAADIVDAVDNSGVTPDVTALVTWILNKEDTVQGHRRQRCATSRTREMPLWNEVARDSKKPVDAKPDIPGATFLEPKRPKRLKRTEAPEPRDQAGVIYAAGRSLSWTINGGEGLTKEQQHRFRAVLGASTIDLVAGADNGGVTHGAQAT
ncbi:hypothetical protein SAMD00023353_7200230 [Rosellinia necatrix]|uniref:UBA domain-containing protein n=1 Tax=Rosellinia necatrix TaxID=77044 RepID=A0A1W2TTM3_ROSNE|nr:hypothetical protein SAMD00023353_7200230 [Rosellinia necatrix]